MFLMYDENSYRKNNRAVNIDKIVEFYIKEDTKNYSDIFYVMASLVNGEATVIKEFKYLHEAEKYLKELVDRANTMLTEERIKTVIKEVPIDEDILD